MSGETLKYCIDGASICTIAATLADWMPAAAAFVSLVWGLIRIYETKLVQKHLRRLGL